MPTPPPSRRQRVAARGAWHPSLSARTAAGQPRRRPRVLRPPAGRGWKGLGGDHASPSHCSRLWLSVSASPPQGKVFIRAQGARRQSEEECRLPKGSKKNACFQKACLRCGPEQRHCSCSQAASLAHNTALAHTCRPAGSLDPLDSLLARSLLPPHTTASLLLL